MLRSLDCDNVQPGDLDPSAADSRVYTEQNRNEQKHRTEQNISLFAVVTSFKWLFSRVRRALLG